MSADQLLGMSFTAGAQAVDQFSIVVPLSPAHACCQSNLIPTRRGSTLHSGSADCNLVIMRFIKNAAVASGARSMGIGMGTQWIFTALSLSVPA